MFSFRDDEGLYTSAGLKRHATGVMKTVGVAVDNLDDLEKVVPALKTLGARHVKYGVVEAHCECRRATLFSTLTSPVSGCLAGSTINFRIYALRLR